MSFGRVSTSCTSLFCGPFNSLMSFKCHLVECHSVIWHSDEFNSTTCHSAKCLTAECHSADYWFTEFHSSECDSSECHSIECHAVDYCHSDVRHISTCHFDECHYSVILQRVIPFTSICQLVFSDCCSNWMFELQNLQSVVVPNVMAPQWEPQHSG
jgi:hypothetical protein